MGQVESADGVFSIEDDQFKLGARLGGGSYGDVYVLIKWIEGGWKKTRMAAKIVCDMKSVCREMEASELHHRNLVRYRSIVRSTYEGKKCFIFVMRRYSCSLEQELKYGLSSVQILTLALSMASALLYLHKNNLIHRDVKPGNILIDNRGGFSSYVLADFGLMRKRSKEMTAIGTTAYMAPEVLALVTYNSKADVYSLGRTLEKVLPEGHVLDRLVKRMVREDPKQRPRMSDVVRTCTDLLRNHDLNQEGAEVYLQMRIGELEAQLYDLKHIQDADI